MTEITRKRTFDTYITTVSVVDHLTPRNVHIRFDLPQDKLIEFKAGQFVQVFVLIDGQDKPRRTSYSIASSPHHKDYIELCVTKVDGGKSSGYIHERQEGDKVTIMGPLGRFVLPEPLARDAVFIATGSGIAPFRSMIYHLLHEKTDKNLYLIFGNRYDDDIIYQKNWEQLDNDFKNFHLKLTLSRPDKWTGEKGYVQDKIEGFVPDPTSKDYFICGLSNMINAVQEKLLSMGVPKEQIHFEKYD